MKTSIAADCLSQLGHETRLSIYQLLVRAGGKGLSVSEVNARLNLASTTLNHHLTNLYRAGLVDKKRDGKTVLCTANFDKMDELVNFLKSDCCTGSCDVLKKTNNELASSASLNL